LFVTNIKVRRGEIDSAYHLHYTFKLPCMYSHCFSLMPAHSHSINSRQPCPLNFSGHSDNNPDEARLLSTHKDRIFHSLDSTGLRKAISAAYSESISFTADKTGVKDLWHFIYKNKVREVGGDL
jgi:hypothetical protein